MDFVQRVLIWCWLGSFAKEVQVIWNLEDCTGKTNKQQKTMVVKETRILTMWLNLKENQKSCLNETGILVLFDHKPTEKEAKNETWGLI